MTEIDFRDLYKRTFQRFSMGKVGSSLLNHVMAGDDKGMDLEESLRTDKFFTTQVITKASEALKKSELKDLSHAAVLLGPDIIRNFVLGHSVFRSFDSQADTKFEGFDKCQAFIVRALEAEDLAKRHSHDHPGIALAAGLVFDVIERWVKSDLTLEQKFAPFFESTWKHSLRTASLAWALCNHERIQVRFKKQVFPGALLHDVGKLLMVCLYPDQYHPLIEKFHAARDADTSDDRSQVEIEKTAFDLSHPEVGSFLSFSTHFLRDFEGIIDYHHDTAILKTRNADMFIVSIIVNIADRISFLIETKSQLEADDIKKILEPHKQNFPLQPQEVLNLVFTLRSKGLLA